MSGLEWSSSDLFAPSRLNTKTRFVGTGLQASTFITSPVAGQMVISTATEGVTAPPAENYSFLKGKLTTRNAANSAWKIRHTTKSSTTTVVHANSTNVAEDRYGYYTYLTMPTSEDFYLFTEITTRFGSDVGSPAGTVTYQFGVDLMHSTNPTIAGVTLLGITPQNTITVESWDSGGAYVTVAEKILTDPIPGGSIVGIWGWFTVTGAVTLRGFETTGSTVVRKKDNYHTNYTNFANSIAWETASADSFNCGYSYHGYS